MMEDGCAFVCTIFLLLGSMIAGFVLVTGNWEPMVIVIVFAAVALVLASFAIASRYL